MSKQTERAWAAGFFDGEGTSGFWGVARPRVGIHIHQNDPEVLYRFQAAVEGVGSVRGPYPQKAASDSYTWQTNKDHAVVMTALWPYLSSIKKRQYEAALVRLAAWRVDHPARKFTGLGTRPVKAVGA